MKLILTEKPSVAKIIAHAVGAREKISGDGNAYCFSGNGYYVAFASGHIYGLGMPEDYGFKEYRLDELPIIPEFRIIENDKGADLRSMISTLMNKDDVTDIICATDAGREGELIFRHIYNANNCQKPVKRLWCNSMTDEAITELMKNLPDDSEYDGLYKAALVRAKSDWVIGMNFSRLYGILDNCRHKVGRVKTPILALVVERDNEISRFVKKTSYRLEMENGALSDSTYSSREEAEDVLSGITGKEVNVISAESTEKKQNRPLLFSLSALQQEANNKYGYTAAQTLETAQDLYEKKLLTYPRTDCQYVSEDMKSKIINIVDSIGDRADYAERVRLLNEQGLNLDSRIINNKEMADHDHHAIIPEASADGISSLNEMEKNIYELVVNRLLCTIDKPYTYRETQYKFVCGDITFSLKGITPIELGWKKYAGDNKEEKVVPEYQQGDVFTMVGNVKECVTQPPKHYTDATLLSVMNNIDNRIESEELKAAVKGKGIGTEATRAGHIEELVEAKYLERSGKNLIATQFGKDFIASIPDNVKSVERTAEWEQTFEQIRTGEKSDDFFYSEIKTFVKNVIRFETSTDRHRTKVQGEKPVVNERVAVGKCPRCAKSGKDKTVYEGKKNFYCESGKDGCGFTIWKENKYLKEVISAKKAEKLIDTLSGGDPVELKAVNKDGETYTAPYILEDTGEYINFKRVQKEKEVIGRCPRCGNNIYEGKLNFYCESGKGGCGFTLWKEDKYHNINVTAANAKTLTAGKKIRKEKKKIDGNTEVHFYILEDTGKYINLKEVKE